MPENTPGFTPSAIACPPYTLVGGPENIKLLFDEELDDRRTHRSFSQGWETLRLLQSNNAAVFSHAVNMGSLLSAQAGVTEAQQTVSPIKLGAADTQNQQPAGAVYPPIRNVDQMGATSAGVTMAAQNQIAAGIAALSDVVTKLAELAMAIQLNAAGGASTPSQTKPPTAA